MDIGMNARKGLKRYEMRAYIVEGPLGAIVIRRLNGRNFQARHKWSDDMPWGLWGMRFNRLGDAREFAERNVGNGEEAGQ